MPYLNISAKWESAPDQDLLQPMGGRGFPYSGFLNAEGTMIWETRPTSAEAFQKGKASAAELQSWMKAAAANPTDKVAAAHVALLDAQGRNQRKAPEMAGLDAAAATPGIDAKILEGFKAWKLSAEIQTAMRSARKDDGLAVYKIWKRGDKPRPEDDVYLAFYYYSVQGAVAAEEADDAKKLLEAFITAVRANADIPEEQKTKLIEEMTAKVATLDAE